MNRFIVPSLLVAVLLAAPASAQDAETGIIEDIISPPGEPCEITAEWFGPPKIAQVGVVHDSHNCGGVGYRLGDGLLCLRLVPCEGWIWIYGGATGATDSSVSCAAGGTTPTPVFEFRFYTGSCVGVTWFPEDPSAWDCAELFEGGGTGTYVLLGGCYGTVVVGI